MSNRKVVIMGAGGHAKVIADIIIKSNDMVYGFLDDNNSKGEEVIEGFKVIGKVEDCITIQHENPEIQFVIGIGSNMVRKNISKKYNINYYTAIHPTACIAIDTKIGEGTVIMANSCINTSAKIGKHCIINTGSIVEHDNIINDFVHISPNGTLAGTVNIGEYTHIGAGAIIKNNTNIAENCVIGAGAVVVKNIEKSGTYIGVPARRMEKE